MMIFQFQYLGSLIADLKLVIIAVIPSKIIQASEFVIFNFPFIENFSFLKIGLSFAVRFPKSIISVIEFGIHNLLKQCLCSSLMNLN